MNKFYVMTKSGTTPPKYVHQHMDTAIAEATRLHHLLNDEVFILEVVGIIKKVEVPVTELKSVLTVKPGYENDDLPF